MKSFKEYLTENWSMVKAIEDIPQEDRHKYLYHVTTAPRAKKIIKSGLIPRTAVRGNYGSSLDNLSYGRAYVTSHHGVRYWVHALATGLADKKKREVEEKDYEKIKILKFPIANLAKEARKKIEIDPLGTRDVNFGNRFVPFDPKVNPRAYSTETVIR